MSDTSRPPDDLKRMLTSPRPGPDEVAAAQTFLDGLLPGELASYLDLLAALAGEVRGIVQGGGIPDPDDRTRAVRFSLALHVLEEAVLSGRLDTDAIPNATYSAYALLEEDLASALPPKAGVGLTLPFQRSR